MLLFVQKPAKMSVGPQEESAAAKSAPRKSVSVSMPVKGWDVLDEGFAGLQGKCLQLSCNSCCQTLQVNDSCSCDSLTSKSVSKFCKADSVTETGQATLQLTAVLQQTAKTLPSFHGGLQSYLLSLFQIYIFLCRVSCVKDEGLGQGRGRGWGPGCRSQW